MRSVRLKLVIATVSALLSLGLSLQVYWYNTEVPKGFERLNFVEISAAATENDVVTEQRLRDIQQLDGRHVFVKGYIYPDGMKEGLTTFLLCRDRPRCAFGPTHKQSEFIKVRIAKGPAATYSEGLVSVAGVFRLRDLAKKIKNLDPVFDIDEAEYLGPSRTYY